MIPMKRWNENTSISWVYLFFVYTVEVRVRARTLNRSRRLQQDKMNSTERGKSPTTELEAKVEHDLDKQMV